MSTIKVSARIKPEYVDMLDSIVAEKQLKTVSKAIRDAILNYIDDYSKTGKIRQIIKISLLKKTVEDWENYRKENENFQSLEDLIVGITEKYIQERREIIGVKRR